MPAPYQPDKNAENFNKAQANNVAAWKEDLSAEQQVENCYLLKRKSIQALFDGYYFEPSLSMALASSHVNTTSGAPTKSSTMAAATTIDQQQPTTLMPNKPIP